MQMSPDETFWEDLLTYIDDGAVIPVLGQGAVTFGDNDQPFYGWLARCLAERLGLPIADDAPAPTLNEIAIRHLIRGGGPNLLYLRLSQIIEKDCAKPAHNLHPPAQAPEDSASAEKQFAKPGPTLHALAGIRAFRLFLTTTFDPLLVRAIDAVRFEGKPQTSVGAFSPEADHVDLPARLADLGGAHVHHLLGRVSPKPNYVVWEEDTMEFVCGLQRKLEEMENLARDLKQHSLLVLGLSFSDWLVRFFLRTAKQRRLSQVAEIQYLAEGPKETLPAGMVLFFGGLAKNVTIVPSAPAAFISELARRWQARNPTAESDPRFIPLPEPSMPDHAVFISYAREDEEQARQIKAGLERAGCRVWYDRERLKPGAHWHAHLEDAVKEHCSLFISVISRTTEGTPEAYFHLERNWAAERANRFSEGEEFYLPVVIDPDLSPCAQREPRLARKTQATQLAGGVVTEDFGRHVRALQEKRISEPH